MARLGPLEWRVLEALWARGTPATGRDLYPAFFEVAPTTLTTTLDRLAQKGILDRVRRGRAFVYSPRLTRAELDAARATNAFRAALHGAGPAEIHPLLSLFVDAIGERHPELLETLESEIRTRKTKHGDEPG